jgi:tetratricopeptide (TPR) repeat protein
MLEFAIDRMRATGVGLAFPNAASMLGLTYALAGRHSEAIVLLEQAVEHSRWGWSHSQPLVCLGEGHLLAGDFAAAERQGARALDLARARGERGVEAWALRLLGEARRDSDARRAEGHYREALLLASELEMRPLIAHCHLGLGNLHRRIGTPEPAREHLATATAMLREMGMRLWLEEAEAQG